MSRRQVLGQSLGTEEGLRSVPALMELTFSQGDRPRRSKHPRSWERNQHGHEIKTVGGSPLRTFSEKMMFLLKPGDREGAGLANSHEKSILGRGDSRCRGAEMGTRLICVRN